LCRNREDIDIRKLLAIFAAITLSANTAFAEEPREMDVQAYALDQYKLVGTNVSVTGTPACLELERCYLYAGSGSTLKPMVSVMFDASSCLRRTGGAFCMRTHSHTLRRRP
jgi:hypothetical protein